MKSIIEGLLFVSGDEGITQKQIKTITETEEDIEKILNELKNEYDNSERGFTLEKTAEKYKLITKQEHHEYYQKLFEGENNKKLTPAALETLAIIAYNGPITRVEIDEIRGVNSSYLIRKLIFNNLIEEIGKSELPGRPNLYKITDGFLEHFGISSIDELPKIEIKEQEEENLFKTKYNEKSE